MSELVRWDEELARAAQEQKAEEKLPVSNISLKSGVMSFRGVAVPGNALNVVVLASLAERRFYAEKWKPDVKVVANCFSQDEVAPHPSSPEPQNATCEGCPRDAWGSDIQGGKGKACKQTRKLLLTPAGEADYGKSDLAVVRLPVTSVRNFSIYVNEIATLMKRPTWAVMTEISVVPDAKTQFKVLFKCVGVVPDEQLGVLKQRMEDNKALLLKDFDEPVEPTTAPNPGAKY